MLPTHHRFPGRGSIGRRPVSRRQAGAMLPGPPPGPDAGAFSGNGPPVQDIVGAIVRELRVSVLDTATAVRLGGRGAMTYFGTVLPPMQRFTAPSEVNQPDSVRAGVIQAGAAPRAMNKTASSGEPQRIARTLPRRPM